jgi:hypothetical protein
MDEDDKEESKPKKEDFINARQLLVPRSHSRRVWSLL